MCDQSASADAGGARELAHLLMTAELRLTDDRAADSNSRGDDPSMCAPEPRAAPSAATSTSSALTIVVDACCGAQRTAHPRQPGGVGRTTKGSDASLTAHPHPRDCLKMLASFVTVGAGACYGRAGRLAGS